MGFYHTSKISQIQRKPKFFSLATIWSQKNLIVETSPLHMLFISTFQPQTVFNDVYISFFVFVCFFVIVFVIVLAFISKFGVSLFSFLFMLLFWSFQSKFMVSHACFCLFTSRLGCFRKSSQPNLSIFCSLSLFSLLPSFSLSSPSAPFSYSPFPSLYPWLLLLLIE